MNDLRTQGDQNPYEKSQYGQRRDSMLKAIEQARPTLNAQLDSSAKNQLANRLSQVQQGAANKGLLYGGLRKQAESGVKADASAQLGQNRLALNNQLSSMQQETNDQYLDRLLAQHRMQSEALMNNNALSRQQTAQEYSGRANMLGSLLGAGGSAAALFSDENLKEEIKPAEKEVDELLESVEPKTYKYKNEDHGEGKHLGFLAQDLEKSQIGKSMVLDTPEGKVVDMGKGLASMLAIQASLNKRLKALEER